MTNAIEQTKREMYDALRGINNFAKMNCHISIVKLLKDFNDPLEAHLEELRKAMVAGNAVIVECAQHSAESFVELERRLSAMTEERDAIQLRLHAVYHAHKTQQDKIATRMPESVDRRSSEQLDANMAVVMSAVRGAQDIMVEYLVPDGIRAKRAMTKLIPLLDNEKLYSALYEIEHAEGKS